MKHPAFNPYLPSWEYVPDGEPYVFDNRVYVYGSHDRFNSYAYCLNDYVCWSAPIDDLGAWRYEGVIFKKTDDPINRDGAACLYAPDVSRGPDGRYYLYYALDHYSLISVAVCDTPAGKYEFYGYVHYPDGTRLGDREGDAFQFDPGVLTEGERTYLYTGFAFGSSPAGPSRGAEVCVLGPDMLTIIEDPRIVAPSKAYAQGTSFEGHAFFEASSIRKNGDTYYFVYSSEKMYELCYATSKDPLSGFVYGGVIVSNNDLGIDTYKPADRPMYYGGNNHGSIVQIGEKWYIFYHRHTNGTNYSRQVCAEEIQIEKDGSIPQVEITSCGLNGGPLPGKGTYGAYIACNLFTEKVESKFTGSMGGNGLWLSADHPIITQDGRDGDEEPGYILNMNEGSTAGFKYFDCKGITKISVMTRGYTRGKLEVKTAWNGEVLGEIQLPHCTIWTKSEAEIHIPDGITALYFTYRGFGNSALLSFTLE